MGFAVSKAATLEFECFPNGENSTCVVKTLEVTEKNRKIRVSTADSLKSYDEFFADDMTINYLPVNIADIFTELKTIKVERSHLKEVTRESLHDLKLLTSLSFRKNELTKLDRHTLVDLRSLLEIDLSDNKIASIEEKSFKSQVNLKTLNLGSNSIKKIESNTFQTNRKLESLSLHDNYLKTLPNFLFANQEALKQLKLNYNELDGLQDKLFAQNGNLEELNVADNLITAIGSKNIDIFKKLKVHNFLYNPCTTKLKKNYSMSSLVKVLSESCVPDNTTQIDWLNGEISEMNRFKREDAEKMKCLEHDLKENTDLVLETRNILKNLTAPRTAPAITKSDIATEISKAASVFKNTLTGDLATITAHQAKTDKAFESLPKNIWDDLTKDDKDSKLASFLNKINECDFTSFAFKFVKTNSNHIEDGKISELFDELEKIRTLLANKDKMYTLKEGLLKDSANMESFISELANNCKFTLSKAPEVPE